MIDVIASIRIKSGHRDEFIEKFKANLPAVLAEDGCIDYYPAVDAESGLSAQATDPDTVTVVENGKALRHSKRIRKHPTWRASAKPSRTLSKACASRF